MPKKFISCVKKVKKSSPNVNPYAVCRVSTGYYGTTHNIGMIHPLPHKNAYCSKCRKRREHVKMLGYKICKTCGHQEKMERY